MLLIAYPNSLLKNLIDADEYSFLPSSTEFSPFKYLDRLLSMVRVIPKH
jgi:hypothetical protein